LLQAFGGPLQGVEGWMARLKGERRPLTCSNLKPQGLSSEGLATLAEKLALGGLDLIKDDHGLADQSYSPFAIRVPAIATAVKRASDRTGVRTRYLPNVTGTLDQLRRQLDQVRILGLDGVLILPMVVGLPAFHQVRRDYPDIAFMAHPALAGTLRIALPLLVGRIFRLLGADAVVFPGYGGRFGSSREECRRLIDHGAGRRAEGILWPRQRSISGWQPAGRSRPPDRTDRRLRRGCAQSGRSWPVGGVLSQVWLATNGSRSPESPAKSRME
jgi:ribulose-bisphosphate carboxylase large chain